MLKILYHRTTFFNCFKIILACSDQGGIENTKNEWIRETYKIFIEKSERNVFGRNRRIWEDNIKMDHKDEGVRKWTTFMWLRIKRSGEICENSNKLEVFKQRDDV
jgi:hypothetical protein